MVAYIATLSIVRCPFLLKGTTENHHSTLEKCLHVVQMQHQILPQKEIKKTHTTIGSDVANTPRAMLGMPRIGGVLFIAQIDLTLTNILLPQEAIATHQLAWGNYLLVKSVMGMAIE